MPAVASTSTEPPAGRPSAPATPTTHGMPSWRAMIAVWLVAPPFSVTSASTSAGSRPAVSAGARSLATSTDGTSGSTTPGSGSPTSRATSRRSMSSRSVARSAIRPPIAVKTSTNWATPSCTASSSVAPPSTRVDDRLAEPLVAGQPGAGGEHLGRRAAGPGRLGGEPLGHHLRRGVVRRQGGLGVRVAGVRRDRLRRHLLRDQHHGPVREPGNDGGAAQRGDWIPRVPRR